MKTAKGGNRLGVKTAKVGNRLGLKTIIDEVQYVWSGERKSFELDRRRVKCGTADLRSEARKRVE